MTDLFDLPRIDTAALCTDEERRIANLLNLHVGAGYAIQVGAVANACGVTPRKAQSIVNHLIHEHGAPIGTSMSRPYGWYLARTTDELAPVIELHRTRALSELSTMAKLSRTTRLAVLARIQTELMEGDAA